jgi:hypothetical protein
MAGPSILRAAHGLAAAGGAILVAETPILDEMRPLDAGRTAEGLALRRRRGRPFRPGNRAASNRGPNLTRVVVQDDVVCNPEDPAERRRARRKANSLAGKRRRELEVSTGGPVSSAVKVELVSWARAVSLADLYDRAGDAVKAIAFAEKASGHGLKAIGIAEREGAGRPKANAFDLDALNRQAEAETNARREVERRAQQRPPAQEEPDADAPRTRIETT